MKRTGMGIAAVGVGALLAQPLFAHKYKTEIATSLYSTTYKDYTEVYDSDASDLYYKVNLARLTFSGKAAPGLKYGLRLNFAKNPNKMVKDGIGPMVDKAFITHSISDSFHITMGKTDARAGAYEESFHVTNLKIPSAFRKAAPNFVTGLFLAFHPLENNKVTVSFTNNPSIDNEAGPDDDTDSLKRQQTPMLGLAYKGSFAGGMVKPFVDLHIENKRELKLKDATEASAKAASNQFVAVGLGVDTGAISGGFDHKIATYGSQALEKGKDDTITSTKVYLAYKMNKVKYFLDYVMDETKKYKDQVEEGELTTKSETKMALGAYIGSDVWKDLEYSVAYVNEAYETETTPFNGTATKADKTPTKTSIILGATIKTTAMFAAK